MGAGEEECVNVKAKVRVMVEVDTGWQDSDASSRTLMNAAAQNARRIVSVALQGNAKCKLIETPIVELIMTEPKEVEAT